MNGEQFCEKYGEVKVKFSGYYKFVFSYSADLSDTKRLICRIGGNTEDIYRLEVNPDDEKTVDSLGPFAGAIYENGEEIEGFYEYE